MLCATVEIRMIWNMCPFQKFILASVAAFSLFLILFFLEFFECSLLCFNGNCMMPRACCLLEMTCISFSGYLMHFPKFH